MKQGDFNQLAGVVKDAQKLGKALKDLKKISHDSRNVKEDIAHNMRAIHEQVRNVGFKR